MERDDERGVTIAEAFAKVLAIKRSAAPIRAQDLTDAELEAIVSRGTLDDAT